MNERPSNTPNNAMPDGAITGNGDVALIWSGIPDRLRLYISKSDFWKGEPGDKSTGGLSPICYIEISLPIMANSEYRVVQNMDDAYIEGTFVDAHNSTAVRSKVCAEENAVMLEITATRPGSSVGVDLCTIEGNGAETYCKELGDMQLLKRAFCDDSLFFKTEAYVSMREVSRHKNGNLETLRYLIYIATNHDMASCRSFVETKARIADDECFCELEKRHGEWWKRFWSKSNVRLHDEVIENHWYAGLYTLACCARNKKFAPGLWGNFSTQDRMPWHSDYHLNYNYQAPFFGLPSANHTELMDCYDTPLEDFVPYAQEFSRKYLGCRGVYFPVGIGPIGLDTSEIPGTKEHGKLFLGQKSNASFAAIVMSMRWYATRDIVYAKEHAYPFLKEVAQFWEDYLRWDGERYIDYNDAIHEVDYYIGPDYCPTRHGEVNPIITLGLIKIIMRCLLDMRSELDVDADRAEKWQHILDHISEPVYTVTDGKEIPRATEIGTEKSGLILQYMYPAGELGSRTKNTRLWNAMYNLFCMDDEWDSENRFCTYYPTAARLGIDPDLIFEKIHMVIDRHGLPNGLHRCGGGGIENNSAVVTTINDMLMQSYEGVLRFFPNWNLSHDASFGTLRADGAFLVSAELKGGVFKAEILSEKGSDLSIEKPRGSECAYNMIKEGKIIPLDSETVTVPTYPGERITIEKA